ncbi:MAG: glycosyltransferase [Candidatus Krumholzibacteria bacterium]|nr:glycosyltransferase [Candidatus Krumholzibacteria bacterium]
MKDLLMIVPFFPPHGGGGVYRALSFVRYLEKYGWRATVISPRADSYWVSDESLLDDVPSSCRVYRTRTLSGQFLLRFLQRGLKGHGSQTRSSRRFGLLRTLGSFVLVPDTYVGWYPFAVRVGRRLLGRGRFDAIFSTSPPETSHLIAHELHRSSAIPWVADFRDPWTHLYVLQTPTLIHSRIHERLERKVCTNASVVVTNRSHKDLLQKKYPEMKSIQIISNGYDHMKFEAYSQVEPPSEICRIFHAGMLTERRSAVAFLQGVRLFLNRQPEAARRLRVLFVGPREDENDLNVRRLQLDEVVEFRDTVPHAESLRLAHSSHILLLIALPHQMPGKFFEYLGARRPVLALVSEGEVSDLVLGLKRGEVTSMTDPVGIADKIRGLYGKYVTGTLEKDYDLSVVREFQRETLTAKLAEYLDSLHSGGRTS